MPRLIRAANLRVEQLEARIAPAIYKWVEARRVAGNWGNWDDAQHWQVLNITTGIWAGCQVGQYPGHDNTTDDDVTFLDEMNKNCVVNVPNLQVHSLTLSKYFGTIKLQNGITITGDEVNDQQHPVPQSYFTYDGPARITGVHANNQVQRGSLVLQPGTTGFWRKGTFTDVTVEVNRSAGRSATLTVQETSLGARAMYNAALSVSGRLVWQDGDVAASRPKADQPLSEVRIRQLGEFSVEAESNTWGSGADGFAVVNDAGGTIRVKTTGRATLQGNYHTEGTTTIEGGTLAVNGTAMQEGATSKFQLRNWSVFEVTKTDEVLRIYEGRIDGLGVVKGGLAIGRDTGAPTDPIIAPMGPNGSNGKIRVVGNFHMYHGEMQIRFFGGNPSLHDVVEVTLNASLTGPANKHRTLNATVAAVQNPIPAVEHWFLTYASNVNPGDFDQFAGVAQTWAQGRDANKYWLKPTAPMNGNKGNVGGQVWRDNGAVAGVFEPGTEATLAGRTVRLFDAAGATQLASTTTNSAGRYLFQNLDAGSYVVQFDRPSGERFAPQNVGTDDTLDSDPDPTTGRLAVALYEDQTDIDAGFRYNAAPIAVDDTYHAHKNTSVAGNVLANDSDPDGDPLTASLAFWAPHGSVALNANGSFVYTPAPNFVGTDSFTFRPVNADGSGEPVLVQLVVTDTPPQAVNDTVTTAEGIAATVAVLTNDTDADARYSLAA